MLGNNFDAARIYAKKCLIDIADKENLEEWYLSITMILLRTNMKEKNKIDALSEARTAMQIAEKRKDRILKEYLRRAISLINDIEFDDITGAKVGIINYVIILEIKIIMFVAHRKAPEEDLSSDGQR